MGIKFNSVCKNLADTITYLLLVDNQETKIAPQLEKALNKKNFHNIHLDVMETENSIPNHDVYVLNLHNLPDSTLSKLVKNIYSANSKAALFVVGEETVESINKIDNAAKNLIDVTKLGNSIQGFIDPNTLDFSPIVQYIKNVENTKKRLSQMWAKIEAANQNLAKVKSSN